ncbi:MAG: hypothetical protein M1602_00070, partial [Firmicutes bacterium]|nr:hypothetical protein [Bacillota bacterium]
GQVLELAGALLALGGGRFAAAVLAPLAARPRDTRVATADLLARHGEIAEAERHVQAIMRNSGEDAALCRRLSWWSSRRGDWAGATRWLRAALDVAPADLTNYLAMAQLWQRRAALTLKNLSRADGERADPVARVLENLAPNFSGSLDVVHHE